MSTATNLPATTPNGNPPAPAPAPAPRPPVALGGRGLVLTSMDELWRFAQVVARSGLAPKGMEDRPETVFVAVQLGLELGLSPMSALQNISVINGRPGIYGDAALALVRASGRCEWFWESESNDAVHGLIEDLAAALENDAGRDQARLRSEIARARKGLRRDADDYGYTAVARRSGTPVVFVRRFTVADAKRAALWGKSLYATYPQRMLLFRARSYVLRDCFGDVLKGLATSEELYDAGPRHVQPLPDTYAPAADEQDQLTTAPAEDDYQRQPAPPEDPPEREPGDNTADEEQAARQDAYQDVCRRLEMARTLADAQAVEADITVDRLGAALHATALSRYRSICAVLRPEAQRRNKP